MIKCLSKAKDKIKNFVVENSVAFRNASIGAGATALLLGSSLSPFAVDGAGSTLDSTLTKATDALSNSVTTISDKSVSFMSSVLPACIAVFGFIIVAGIGIKFVRKFMK